MQKVGRKLSLISDTEAEANDGISDVTDRAAIQVSPATTLSMLSVLNEFIIVYEITTGVGVHAVALL